jgi:hypothetical protein
MKVEDKEFLDRLEAAMVEQTIEMFNIAGKHITKKEARTIISKIGVRILVGGDVADKIIMKQ